MKKKIDTLTEKEIKKAFNADIKAGNYQLSFEGNKITLEKANRKTSREAKNCIKVVQEQKSIWESWGDSLWGKSASLDSHFMWNTQPSQQQELSSRQREESLRLRGLSEQLSSQSGVYDMRMSTYQSPIMYNYTIPVDGYYTFVGQHGSNSTAFAEAGQTVNMLDAWLTSITRVGPNGSTD